MASTSIVLPSPATDTANTAMAGPQSTAGLQSYYQSKLERLELEIRNKTNNIRRLEAQRNVLNTRSM